MPGFVWVTFFKKATRAFCYPALLTVDGFSSKRLVKIRGHFDTFTEARICLCNLCMYGHAPLLTGIYNNYQALSMTKSDEDYMLTNVLLS